ncbi:MAG: nitroreductase family protein [Lachnospiraceae bacterium]|nr:nitroreductase family protein [Lachnospiraceae bacterium]
MNSIFHRISVRRFEDRPVEKTEAILRAAMQAPSAANQQPWEFYVVTDKKKILELSRTNPNARAAANAPAVIVPVYRKNCYLPDFAEIDLSIATENLWLETDAQGLRGVWIGIAPWEDRMRTVERVLDIPEHLRAFALFPYGYPAETRAQQNRFDESRIHYVE